MNLHARMRTALVGVFSGLVLTLAVTAQAADVPSTGAQAASAPQLLAQAEPHNDAGMWRSVRQGNSGITTIKGAETGVLVDSRGETWRQLRNGPVTLIGGAALVVVVAAILLFHLWKGSLRLSAPPSGRRIRRFSLPERIVHNVVAISFVLLALGGLLMIFGKYLLVPLIGHSVFAMLMQVMKPVHNFLGLLFVAGLAAMILMWLKDNVWKPIDAEWIRRAGGLIDRSHVPSGRFNFGEKTWFWIGVTILGLTVSATGLLLDFPSYLQLRADLQTTNLVHGIGALLMTLLALGHIYMGTIGVEGALESMRSGEVDEVWARDHHRAWYEQVAAKGKQS